MALTLSDEIKKVIKKWMAPEWRPCSDQAFDIFQEQKPTLGFSQVELRSEIFPTIQMIALGIASGSSDPPALPRQTIEYSPDNLLRSKEALGELRPEIEALRLELFGQAQVPFESLDAALRWLKKESAEDARAFIERIGDQRQKLKVLDKKLQKLIEERNRLTESYVQLGLSPDVGQTKLGGWPESRELLIPLPGRFRTFPDTRLRKLA